MRYKCNSCHQIIEKDNMVPRKSPNHMHDDMYHWRTEWISAPYPMIGTYATGMICGPIDILYSKDLSEEELDKWETNLGIKL